MPTSLTQIVGRGRGRTPGTLAARFAKVGVR